jgi:hypothetical protein
MPDLALDDPFLGGVVGQPCPGEANATMIKSWVCDIASFATRKLTEPAGAEERSRLIDIDPPPSPERLTVTISAGFAASAAKTVPEPNDQASSVADLAME